VHSSFYEPHPSEVPQFYSDGDFGLPCSWIKMLSFDLDSLVFFSYKFRFIWGVDMEFERFFADCMWLKFGIRFWWYATKLSLYLTFFIGLYGTHVWMKWGQLLDGKSILEYTLSDGL